MTDSSAKYMEAPVSSDELIQSCSNYKRYDAYLSRIRYARVPLNNITGSTVALSYNATTLMEFKIPSKTVINLAKSKVEYNYTLPAYAGYYAATFENNQDLCQWAYFGNGGGLGIVDVNYVDRYTSVVGPLRTAQQELITRDVMETKYSTNQTSQQNVLPFSQDGLLAGNINSSANSYEDMQYLAFSPGQNTQLVRSRLVSLSDFKDTFLASDKNSIFPSDMYLRFNTQYASRLGFYCQSTAQPNGTYSTATSTTTLPINATTVPNGISFMSVYLYLAIEENKVLVDSLMSALMAGSIKMVIPYTYTYRFGATGSGSNLTVTLTRQFGHKIKRILYAPFNGNGSETSNYSFDHSNVNGTKITTLQSSIDSRPLTDYQLNCFNPNNPINPAGAGWVYPSNNGTTQVAGTSPFSDDYREMRRYLAGSCIEDYLSYQINWLYQDVWGLQDNMKSFNQVVADENIDDGLNLLDADHVYTLQLNTPCIGAGTAPALTSTNNSITHYLFALFERNLLITPTGIAFA